MVTFLVLLFGVTMLYMSCTTRLEAYTKTLSLQGFLLFLIVASGIREQTAVHSLFLMFETLLFKTFLIPNLLQRSVKKNNIFREVEPFISNLYSLMISSVIFAGGLYSAYLVAGVSGAVKPVHFGISVSTMISGLFIIMTRKKIITHVAGFIAAENGIFLLSLSLASKMPFVVDMGVLLEVFTAVFIFTILIARIGSKYDDLDVDGLSKLRD